MNRSPSKRILIVEDDGDLCQVLKFVLEDADYEVEISSDGVNAPQIVHDQAIDLIVLDVTLSGTSGLEVARALRADEKTAHVLIAVHTGRTEDSVRAEFADYDSFMGKGDDAEMLLQLVSATLAKATPDAPGAQPELNQSPP